MYKYLLQSVEGIQWFGVATLLIFFSTFCLAIFNAWRSQTSDLDSLSRLPLDE